VDPIFAGRGNLEGRSGSFSSFGLCFDQKRSSPEEILATPIPHSWKKNPAGGRRCVQSKSSTGAQEVYWSSVVLSAADGRFKVGQSCRSHLPSSGTLRSAGSTTHHAQHDPAIDAQSTGDSAAHQW